MKVNSRRVSALEQSRVWGKWGQWRCPSEGHGRECGLRWSVQSGELLFLVSSHGINCSPSSSLTYSLIFISLLRLLRRRLQRNAPNALTTVPSYLILIHLFTSSSIPRLFSSAVPLYFFFSSSRCLTSVYSSSSSSSQL